MGDLGSIPVSGRSAGGEHSNPLQYSCLENLHEQRSLVATVHGVAKSWTRLSDYGWSLDGLCIPKELPSGGSTTAVLRPCSKSQGLVDTLVVVTGFPAQACDNLVRMRPSAGCGREASGRRSFLVHGSRGAGRTWPWSPPTWRVSRERSQRGGERRPGDGQGWLPGGVRMLGPSPS